MTTGVDFSRYQSPGVYTETLAGPQVGITSDAPTSVAIFGDSVTYQTDVQTLVVPADFEGSPVPTFSLRQVGILLSTIKVTDPTGYTTYELDPGDGSGDYGVISTPGVSVSTDNTVQIVRISGNNIVAGQSIQVSYQYTNSAYYNVYTFYDFDDVRDRYGAPFDSSGNITSELTLAANFAFLNGAQSVITVAVKHSTNNGPTTSDYINALNLLSNVTGIAVVVCANGNPALHQYISQHVVQQSSSVNRSERRAICGLDGSVTAVPSTVRIEAAQAIVQARVALVSPATVNYYNPNTNSLQVIGGHFVAAALAGLTVALNPATPLTRKTFTGFSSFPEQISESQKNIESQSGLLVCEQTRAGALRVRHGLTTDPSTLLTREWSITGQSDALAYRLRDFLENDGLIGGIISDTTLINVKASADSALQSLIDDGTIINYTNLKARQLPSTPDVVEVRFEWLAAVPLNYIVNRYSINVSSGTTTDISGDASTTSSISSADQTATADSNDDSSYATS